MKAGFIFISAALLAATPLAAQGIRKSVEVTNEYETRFADFQKTGPSLSVPDSLYNFDYSFDYSVFDSPYRGAYEFTPYEVKITPDPIAYDGRTLALRAGAGYSLHPVLDVAYTPIMQTNLGVSVFNRGRGYYGRSFHDLHDELGVSGHYLSSLGRFKYSASYDGSFAGNSDDRSSYHSGGLSACLASPSRSGSFFAYSFLLDYRFGTDGVYSRLPGLSSDSGVQYLGNVGEHNLSLGGSLGPVLDERYRFLLDFNFNMLFLSDGRADQADRNAGLATLTPHLSFLLGTVDIDAGVRLDYLTSSTSFTIAPVLRASLELEKPGMQLYAGMDGGRSLNSYHSLKGVNRLYQRNSSPDAARERVNFYAGVQGSALSHLQYGLKGGYSLRDDSPLDAVQYGLGFANYSLAYAELQLAWISERLNADGTLHFAHAGISTDAALFAPANFSGDFSITYNWLKRIYAGVLAEGASVRRSTSSAASDIPGYVDLGLYGEYRLNRRWGVWAHLGNLIGMSIERHPGCVEKGPYFTAGITFGL